MSIQPERITFLMVGCQRCGSTWVDAALREHPEIYLPPQKQTYFFDKHYDRGIDWYLNQFEDVTEQHAAVGEVSTGYCLPGAVEQVARHLPHIQIIMALRHPVERAYSNYLTRKAEQQWPDFETAIERDPDLLERGRYIEQMENLLEHYPRKRVLFLLYDDLDRDDRTYLGSILEFLGLDPLFESSQYGQRRNAAMFPHLRKALHGVGLKPTLSALSRSKMGDVVRKIKKHRGSSSARDLDPVTRAKLVEYYRPLNDRLGKFLNRDLSSWNR